MDPKVSSGSRVPHPIITSGLAQLNSSIGSSPRSGLQEERREQLAKEFYLIDSDHNNFLSFDEVYNFLSQRQGEPFDVALCQDLFSRMDKNHDNQISLEEFIDSYTDTEEVLRRKMKEIKKIVQKHQESLNENKEKLKKAESSERMTATGVMEGCVLTVCVQNAQGLSPSNASGSADPYVTLQCGKEKISGSVQQATLNPVWNESFTFPVSNRSGDLSLVIKSKGLFGDKFVGMVKIPLGSLQDQLKHEQYYQLSDEQGSKSQGRIRLEVQWIWSKIKYFQDICKGLEKIIEEEKARLEQIKEKLNNLRRPFGHLADMYTRPDMIGTPHSGTLNLEGKVAQRLEELTSLRISIVSDNEDYLYYSILVYMVLSVVICYARPDFFNVMLSIYGFIHWIRFDFYEMKVFAFLLLGSEVSDFLWIYYYAADWGANGGSSELSVWLSFIILVGKLPLSLIFWMKSAVHN